MKKQQQWTKKFEFCFSYTKNHRKNKPLISKRRKKDSFFLENYTHLSSFRLKICITLCVSNLFNKTGNRQRILNWLKKQ
jgi:hypothetical protein